MDKIRLLKELGRYVVFNNKIVREITGKERDYVRLMIYRLKKENHITEIEKNKYTTHKDPLLIASNMVWPSYLSCWTALRYHSLTEQLPTTIFVITTRARKRYMVRFNNTEIVFVKTKPKYFFGFKKEVYGNYTIFIADPEKTLIDSALFKKISVTELGLAVRENLKNINTRLLVKYILIVENKTLAKRFGFLLERVGIDVYDKLKGLIDSKYVPLDYAMPKDGKKNEKWRIIENAKC